MCKLLIYLFSTIINARGNSFASYNVAIIVFMAQPLYDIVLSYLILLKMCAVPKKHPAKLDKKILLEKIFFVYLTEISYQFRLFTVKTINVGDYLRAGSAQTDRRYRNYTNFN